MQYTNGTSYQGIDSSTRILDRLEIKILLLSIMILLCLITTVGNLIVVYKYGRKRNGVGNLFIVSLAIADLIVGAFVMPIASIYSFSEKWNFSLVLCQIWLGADYTASTASILNLLTLSLDRYWSITSPLKYLSKRTKSRALCMIGIVWFISLLWIIPITTWPYIANNGIRIVQSDECDTEYKHNLAFKLITALFNFYVPLIAMIAINAKIYLVIRQRYRSPMMQYTSGPFSKYSWAQPSTAPNGIPQNNSSETNCSKQQISTSTEFIRKFKFYSRKPKESNENSEHSNRTSFSLNNHRKPDTSLDHIKFSSGSIIKRQIHHDQKSEDKTCIKLNSFKNIYARPSMISDEQIFKACYNSSLCGDSDCRQDTLDSGTVSSRNNQCLDLDKQNVDLKYSNSSLCESSHAYQKSNETSLNEIKHNLKKTRPPSILRKNVSQISMRKLGDNAKDTQLEQDDNRIIKQRQSRASRISFRITNQLTLRTNRAYKTNQAFFNKQEKAFAQLAAIVIGFTICFTPYFVIFLVVAFCSTCVNTNLFQLALWLGYINSTINPFLYTLSSRRYCKAFNKAKTFKTTNNGINKKINNFSKNVSNSNYRLDT